MDNSKKVFFLIFAVIFLFTSTSLVSGYEKEKLDPRIVPGNSFRVEFPELPKTLALNTASMSIIMPTDYDKNRSYPLYLWLNGERGKAQARRAPFDDTLFISIGLPLFKEVPPTSNDSSKLLLRNSDAEITWKAYSKMFKELKRLIPNIDYSRSVAGGFSNGAHCLSMLISDSDTSGFCDLFKGFFLIDGGWMLRKYERLSGKKILFLPGENSGQSRSMKRRHNEALKHNADSELMIMENTGHSINPAYFPKIKDWILRKVVYEGLDKNLKSSKKYIEQGDFIEALKSYRKILKIIDKSRPEWSESQKVFKKISEQARLAFKVLREEKPSSKMYRKFIIDWSPCPCVEDVKDICAVTIRKKIKKLRRLHEEARIEKLLKLHKLWKDYPIKKEILAELDLVLIKKLEKALNESSPSIKIGQLLEITKGYQFSETAKLANMELTIMCERELAKIDKLVNTKAKINKLNVVLKKYSGADICAMVTKKLVTQELELIKSIKSDYKRMKKRQKLMQKYPGFF